jgi:hypothetical protein
MSQQDHIIQTEDGRMDAPAPPTVEGWLKDIMGEQWVETDPKAAMSGYDPDVYSPPSIIIPGELYIRYRRAMGELEAIWRELYALEDQQLMKTPDGLIRRHA